MHLIIPDSAKKDGFVIAGLGAHSSRTIMLSELRLLLGHSGGNTDLAAYRLAILEDNVLLKRTVATRRESLRRLRELYGLNEDLTIFRALRHLWNTDPSSQPLLALLCSLARDPMLRATASVILSASQGDSVTPQMLASSVETRHPDRLNETTLANIGRHAASSWKQSGHLKGRQTVSRARVSGHPTSVTYALLLGYLCGVRGQALFETAWAVLLDTPIHELYELAFRASQQGWLDYRQTGDVTDVGFSCLLRST